MAAQFLSTSRLSNLISMISLGQQSGILRVMRGEGATREMGQIKFVAGSPVAALLGPLTGPNALNVLMNWGECLYAFDEVGSGEAVDQDSFPGGSTPADGSGFSSLNSSPASSLPHQSYSSGSPLPDQSSYPSRGSTPGYGSSGSIPVSGYPGGQPPQSFSSSASGFRANMPSTVIFRRIAITERIEQLPLDRRERMILLLVDGRRSIAEISRITRRDQSEIYAVLEHLASLSLIQPAS